MSEPKVRQHQGVALKAVKENRRKGLPLAMYIILKIVLTAFQVAAVGILVFSLGNFADVARIVPLISLLGEWPAFWLSYLVVLLEATYCIMIFRASISGFFRDLASTFTHLPGILFYLLAVPLLFLLGAGFITWFTGRTPWAAMLMTPFRLLPETLSLWMNKNGILEWFVAIQAGILLATLAPVGILAWVLKPSTVKLGVKNEEKPAAGADSTPPQS